jgi:hypothetical protein
VAGREIVLDIMMLGKDGLFILKNLRRKGQNVLRIQYDPDPDFCAILHFVGNLDEELGAIDQLLSDEKLLKLIEADLSRRYPHTTQTGRNSTPVEVIVRMLVGT